jgi:hypothetical protein
MVEVTKALLLNADLIVTTCPFPKMRRSRPANSARLRMRRSLSNDQGQLLFLAAKGDFDQQ